MEKLLSKLKTNAVISLILGLLSLIWIFLDYFIITDLIAQYNIDLSIYILLLAFSGIAFLMLILFLFAVVFYIFRISMKYKSEQKKLTKNNIPTEKTTTE